MAAGEMMRDSSRLSARPFRVGSTYAKLREDSTHGIVIEARTGAPNYDIRDALLRIAVQAPTDERLRRDGDLVSVELPRPSPPSDVVGFVAVAAFYVHNWGVPSHDLAVADPKAEAVEGTPVAELCARPDDQYLRLLLLHVSNGNSPPPEIVEIAARALASMLRDPPETRF